MYDQQQVSTENGMKLANDIGAVFQYTSAKSGVGINSLFENLGRKYLDPTFDYQAADKTAMEKYKKKKEEEKRHKDKKNNNNNRGVKLDFNKNKKKGCCG